MTSVHLPFCFRCIDLLLCRVWHLCDSPWGVYAFFRLISIAKYVLKSLSVGFQFEGQSLKYSVSMFQKKVDNWKPQAGGHVTGLYRRSISGRNDLLLSFPTGVLSLPLAALFFYFFTRCFLRCALTNWTPGRGYSPPRCTKDIRVSVNYMQHKGDGGRELTWKRLSSHKGVGRGVEMLQHMH